MTHIEPVKHSEKDIEQEQCCRFSEYITAETLRKSSEIYLLADTAYETEWDHHKNHLADGQATPAPERKLRSSFIDQ